MLNKLRELNKDIKIYSIRSEEFKKYGRVNFTHFRFEEFFTNYFSSVQGKNAAYTGVYERLLTQ